MSAVEQLRAEVAALREELTKARERIAVLEARNTIAAPVPSLSPYSIPCAPPYVVTSGEKTYGSGVMA